MNPRYFDIHAHLNFTAFDSDRDEVIKRALDNGVFMANVGTQSDTSKKAIEIAEKYEDGVYAIVGLHPIHTDKSFHDEKELGEGGREFTSRGEIFDTDVYRKMVAHPKVVAIGECGLDYYRGIKNQESGIKDEEQEKIEKQKEVFRKQIELAIETGKPLMLHIRNAYEDALSIIKSYNFNLKSSPANLHFFAGDIAVAKKFLDLGFSFSFTGVITFAKDYEEIIRYLPIDRIMSETDCPYVAPVPFRGKRNEPFYVSQVINKISLIKELEEDLVRETLVGNAKKFFGI